MLSPSPVLPSGEGPPPGVLRPGLASNAVVGRNSSCRCLLAAPRALRRAHRRRLSSQWNTLLRRGRRCSRSSVTSRSRSRPRPSVASLLALRCSASAQSMCLPHARAISHLSLAGACVRRKRRDRQLRPTGPACFSPASSHHAGPHGPAAHQAAAGLHSPVRCVSARVRPGIIEAPPGLESPLRCESPSDTLKALWLSER